MSVTIVEVKATIVYDATHLIGHDAHGIEIEEPRWVLMMQTPDSEITWAAKSAAALVAKAERWGHGRGVHVTINFLTPVGGTEIGEHPRRAVSDSIYNRHIGQWQHCENAKPHTEHQRSYSPWRACPGVRP